VSDEVSGRVVEELQTRVHGDASLPTLVYLPGLHGDWTAVGGFRRAMSGRVRFVEFTYPRTLAWSLDDYARAVLAALREKGITGGWLLAESFGSQVGWAMLKQIEEDRCAGKETFKADGLILAGGFVRHPFMLGVWLAEALLWTVAPLFVLPFAWMYGAVMALRLCREPERLGEVREFVRRRTWRDLLAWAWRVDLIRRNDPRPIARAVTMPVYYLSGLVEVIVPWGPVRWWLRRNCPGLRDMRLIFSDHAILPTTPRKCARHVAEWMRLPEVSAAS